MANTHTGLNEEVEITLNLRIKISQASYYGELSEADLKAHIEQAKKDVKDALLQKIKDEYCSEELTKEVYYNYEVFNAE